jgi:chemotaxis protein methyltransferase CheR
MEVSSMTVPHDIEVTDREFALFRELIAVQAGIALNEHKRHLLRARLAKRLRDLGLDSFSAYYDFLTRGDPSGA